jgi:hypothetical protein
MVPRRKPYAFCTPRALLVAVYDGHPYWVLTNGTSLETKGLDVLTFNAKDAIYLHYGISVGH